MEPATPPSRSAADSTIEPAGADSSIAKVLVVCKELVGVEAARQVVQIVLGRGAMQVCVGPEPVLLPERLSFL